MGDHKLTFRRYQDDIDFNERRWDEEIFEQDTTFKCPTYIHRTPPCQGSCPSGEDIRGWLSIVRGIEKPPADMDWHEYAFRRSTTANPFPAIMGRVCPAPCQEGCNRNEVEDFVGINSIEQYIGDYALQKKYGFQSANKETNKQIAIIGGGPGGLACAYQLRLKGHGCTIFDNHSELGGMMRYGIPGYRTPRETLDHEIQRILDMGVTTRLNTRVGDDVTMAQLEQDFDAIVIAIGAQSGWALDAPGGDAPNCISGVAFLDAYNDGRLVHSAKKVVVIGGGDTAMDVVSVARRLGHIKNPHQDERVENVILNQTAQEVASVAKREGADVILAYRRPIDKMPAAQHEIEAAEREGVQILPSLIPVEAIIGDDGRAHALRVASVDWTDGKMQIVAGSEQDIECDLIVAAIGQTGNLEGMQELDNGRGLIDADIFYQIPDKPGYFVIGDIIKPHLLTTAIGHASIAAESIDNFVMGKELRRRPRVDSHHFDLLDKLRETDQKPADYSHQQVWGSDHADFAVHNYEDRSSQEIIPSDKLFLGHFDYEVRRQRTESTVGSEQVLGNFEERFQGLSEAEAREEAERCMCCGMCLECDNCVIYCPQVAVLRTGATEATTGRYVYTDYNRCIGCHICADVCPTGYIAMAIGE